MLKELKTTHRKICQLSFDGFNNTDIAAKLDVSKSTVSKIVNSALGKAYINGLLDRADTKTLDVRQKLVQMNSLALDAFDRILKPDSKAPYAVQFNTAKDVLDRTGFKPTNNHNVDMSLHTKSDEDLEAEIAALEASIVRTYNDTINNPPNETDDSDSDSDDDSDISDED